MHYVSGKIQNPLFFGCFWTLSQNEIFPKKSGSVSFLPLRQPNFMRSFRKMSWAILDKTRLPTDILTYWQWWNHRIPFAKRRGSKNIYHVKNSEQWECHLKKEKYIFKVRRFAPSYATFVQATIISNQINSISSARFELVLSVSSCRKHSVAYLELCQTSKMKGFVKMVSEFQPLTIFEKRSILDVQYDMVLNISSWQLGRLL